MRESETVEFKETTKELKQAMISMSAMLNKHGICTVYFGVKNNGKPCSKMIIGMDTTRDISIMIRDNIRPAITPTITIEKLDDADVIKVQLEGSDIPYSAFGRYYIRSDDEDLILDPTQLKNLFERSDSVENQWERKSSGHNVDCIDESRLLEYMDQCNEAGRLAYVYKDQSTTLTKLGLMFDKEHLNNAGYYLFSKEKPLRLKMAIFNTDERLSFSDIKQFEGNIFECMEEGIKYIKTNMHWSANIVDQKRIEIPEIPLEAVREIVINSFVHMKYGVQPYNEIYFTPERLSVFNPGSLPKGTEPKTFANGTAPSILRNPIIANVLYLNKSIDSFGTGFHRVFTSCSNTNINFVYKDTEFGFTFQFIRNNHVKHDVHLNTLSQIELNILDAVSKNPEITIQGMVEHLGISKSITVAAINKLKSKGALVHNGARKNGRWTIVR